MNTAEIHDHVLREWFFANHHCSCGRTYADLTTFIEHLESANEGKPESPAGTWPPLHDRHHEDSPQGWDEGTEGDIEDLRKWADGRNE